MLRNAYYVHAWYWFHNTTTTLCTGNHGCDGELKAEFCYYIQSYSENGIPDFCALSLYTLVEHHTLHYIATKTGDPTSHFALPPKLGILHATRLLLSCAVNLVDDGALFAEDSVTVQCACYLFQQ